MRRNGFRQIGRAGPAQKAAVAAYVALAAYPFAAVADSGFWSSATGPVALAIFAALIIAFLARRRWAWWTLLVVESLALIAVAATEEAAGVAVQLARLALLLSPPLRWYFARGGGAGTDDTAPHRRSLLPGPPSRPSLARAAILLLAGALLAPLSIAAVALGGPQALLGCALPGLVALAAGVRELNRWTESS
ncbi:MAG TPA: hypothetical protein VGW75_10795 [Solirubrobacteraceae bacterium]|jgi:hypothetical protein|nr:hypothetical protein [Solirubrobacteraceae bacterium]